LKLLSAANNSFKRDYHGEDEEGQQVPILTVFHKGPDGVIRQSWASELLFMPTELGQDPRHVGTVGPMWTLLDLTPGRAAGRVRADRTRMPPGLKCRRILSKHKATLRLRA
jgi:predicted dithiol-disulfide oxidoreductase (DUF899 family)